MNTADKLMNIAINGDTGEDVVVKRDQPRTEAADDDGDVVEETTVTKTVRHKSERRDDDVVIIED